MYPSQKDGRKQNRAETRLFCTPCFPAFDERDSFEG